MHNGRWRLLLAISFLVAISAFGQVTARQGESAKAEVVPEFHSPMILEIPLSVADRTLWNKGAMRTKNEVGLRKFTCDGVSFRDFAISARRTEYGVKISLHSLLANRPSVDKLATLKFEIFRGEEVLAETTARGIDVEEGKTGTNDSYVVISERKLGETPVPSLRITMSVVENP